MTTGTTLVTIFSQCLDEWYKLRPETPEGQYYWSVFKIIQHIYNITKGCLSKKVRDLYFSYFIGFLESPLNLFSANRMVWKLLSFNNNHYVSLALLRQHFLVIFLVPRDLHLIDTFRTYVLNIKYTRYEVLKSFCNFWYTIYASCFSGQSLFHQHIFFGHNECTCNKFVTYAIFLYSDIICFMSF